MLCFVGHCNSSKESSSNQEPRFLLFWFQSFDFLQLSFGVSEVPLLKRRKSRSFVSIMAIELLGPERKVVVHLRATGDAPILKKAKFKTAGTNKFSTVIEFLRHQLHRYTGIVSFAELLAVYIQNFGFDGKLVVNYACSMAWG
ncbi:hypothetical protein HPP92_018538 [Vanilla planifolia]|uniref:Ubiquitin-like protein ATG12 n=1 Tax=Vanilla planifolia TaxID=51239 RepID=A0A835UQR4_VANPL|nr:hypothetical protein HPP92_018538 [Vanilla planifolia]